MVYTDTEVEEVEGLLVDFLQLTAQSKGEVNKCLKVSPVLGHFTLHSERKGYKVYVGVWS
jgi:hypothetical protein